MKRNKKLGFTLIEIIIALAIFAIIATVTSSVLYNVLSTRKQLDLRSQQLAEMQIAIVMLQRDLQQFIDRPVTNINRSRHPSLLTSSGRIEFTTAAKSNPFGLLQQSNLQRVTYYLDSGQLIREASVDVDPNGLNQKSTKVLVHDVESLVFNFIGEANAVNSTWPASNLQTQPLNQLGIIKMPIPRAVLVKINLKTIGEMSLLIAIPNTTI